MKKFKGISFYLVFLIILIGGVMIFGNDEKTPKLSYTEAIQKIKEQKVSNINFNGETAEFTFTEPVKGAAKATVKIPNSEAFINKVDELVEQQNPVVTKLNKVDKMDYSWVFSLLPTLLIIGLMAYFMFSLLGKDGGMNGKAMSFGKSRHRILGPNDKKITFNDVAGADEEKEELREIVDFLKSPQKYNEMGARIPKGVLLVGPPGTGKTLLAKSVAGEAGVPFYSITGSDFVEMFVGVGASRVRDLFETAKKTLPCIVFIDEVDAVGRQRGAGLGGGNDEREQTLNQLLVEMDGFVFNEGIVVIAATNREDVLDPALLRPGRFDRRVYVGHPDVKGREEILKVHARNKRFTTDIDFKDIANLTPGFTGADLENLLNESALLAAKKNKNAISMEEIKEATYKVQMGPEKKSRIITERDKKLTAYHEAGHAIAVRALSTTDKVDRVSIVPVGQAGGYTAYKPTNEDSYRTKAQLLERIKIALGGRAAEEVALGEISTGAYGDLKSVNSIARNMITQYGMSEKLGCMIVGDEGDSVFIGRDLVQSKSISDQLAADVDAEVKKIIDDSYKIVIDMLIEKRDILDRVAEKLIEKERIEGDEFEAIYNNEEYIPPVVETEVANIVLEQAENQVQESVDSAGEEE